jgi:type VI secretion system protein ImpA
MDMQVIDVWLEPLDGDACGPDMEYDLSFMELEQAVAGKPETQFGPAEAPDWRQGRELAEQLFGQTRDLRVAMQWTRAVVNLEGLEGLPAGLALLHGWLDRYWEELHPRPDPDDGDAFARLSVLASLDALGGLLGDVRQAQLLVDRRVSGLRVRTVEIARDKLAPRADETVMTRGQIEGTLRDLPDVAERVGTAVNEALDRLKALQTLMDERFGAGQGPDLKNLREMLQGVLSLVPQTDGAAEPTEVPAEAEQVQTAPVASGRSGVFGVESRQDAVRAIQLVCAYLDRNEPTNPAQLLLRRAERLIDKDFLQLVRDLAPDALNEVAKILGVDPESVRDSGSY